MTIIRENSILVITENNINDSIREHKNIDIKKTNINKQAVRKINIAAKEKYSYIFFTKDCNYSDELINFLPIFSIDDCCNKLFINEILVNPIIIENIRKLTNNDSVLELAIMLKHILRNNIKKEDFVFTNEIESLKKLYNCNKENINNFKGKIYKSIEDHYCQNIITRKIKYRMNKDEIVKMALYKLIDVINDNLKNTNELVFKKFISIII